MLDDDDYLFVFRRLAKDLWKDMKEMQKELDNKKIIIIIHLLSLLRWLGSSCQAVP